MPTDIACFEIRPAFAWTCDACGRDNFAHAVTLEAAHLSDEARADARRLLAALPGEGGGVACLLAPAEVACGWCGGRYETTEPEG